MEQQLTIKLSFDLSDNEITTSLSGVKFIAITKQHCSEMESTAVGRFRLLIHSCSDAFFLDWSNQKQCLTTINTIIKSLEIFNKIILNGMDGKSNSVNRTRKINKQYGIRFIYNKHRKLSVLSFISRKVRFVDRVAIKEKKLLDFHSDHNYNFPVIIENDTTQQLVVPAGLDGLCRRLTNMVGALKEIKTLVSNCN